MNKRVFSTSLFRVLIMIALVIPLTFGATSPVQALSTSVLIGWGNNYWGQASIPAGLTDVVAMGGGEAHSLALQSDGTVVGWGHNYYGQTNIPSGLTDVVAIAAGNFHNLALKGDGSVVAWGANYYGQTNIPSGLTDVVAIDGGRNHSLALKSDGTVVAWGSNFDGQVSVPAGLTDVVAMAAGNYHNLALKGDGTLGGGGANYSGVTSIPSGLTDVVAIASGKLHNLVLVSPNAAPTADPGGPYLGAVNTSIQFDGSVSSDPDNDPLTYAWDFGDSTTGTGTLPIHRYPAAGIYNACLTVNDGSVSSDPACTLAVVYDPSAGFVTGGGWLNSPAGAYRADENLSGQATFGFVAKYKRGETVPSGGTAFEFDLAGMAFASQSYEWLVVNQAGSNAQFKGTGLINGAADPNGSAYKFQLWASDGSSTNSADTFRIKIWWEDSLGVETVVYDNGTAQAIGAGNILVHTGR